MCWYRTMMTWHLRQTCILKKRTPINIWTIYRVTQNNVKTEFPTVGLNATDVFYQTMTVSLNHCVTYNKNSLTEATPKTLSKLLLKSNRICHRKMPYISLPRTNSVWVHVPLYTIHPSRTLVHYYTSTGIYCIYLQQTKSSGYTRTLNLCWLINDRKAYTIM